MANNRFYLVCDKCRSEDKEDHLFFLGKYYPSNGWYPNVSGEDSKIERIDKLAEFLEKHSHEQSLFGYSDQGEEPFSLYFEAGRRGQDQILIALSKAVSEQKG